MTSSSSELRTRSCAVQDMSICLMSLGNSVSKCPEGQSSSSPSLRAMHLRAGCASLAWEPREGA